MSRQSKYQLQIGDVLYEPNKGRKKVIEWKVVNIFVEDYMCGSKTIIVVENEELGKVNRFLSDVRLWLDSASEAEMFLKEVYGA